MREGPVRIMGEGGKCATHKRVYCGFTFNEYFEMGIVN
jgi:hypothetical protein